MKKVLKNILKWLVCVFLTFAVIFTVVQFQEISLGMCFRTAFFGNTERFEDVFGEESISNIIKYNDEITNKQFSSENDVFGRLYSQYPSGVTRTIYYIAQYMGYGEVTIVSLVLGLIIGTAIFMLMDEDKKGLKIAILMYILAIVILGFLQGSINISGEGLTLLDYWMFPDEYIIPVSIAFGLVVTIRYIRQKDIANKLNEKLKQIKEEKTNK